MYTVRSTVLFRSNFGQVISAALVICTPVRVHVKQVLRHSSISQRRVVHHVRDRLPSRVGGRGSSCIVFGSKRRTLLPRVATFLTKLGVGGVSSRFCGGRGGGGVR